MKLPAGKVTKTVPGGLESFQAILDELKAGTFTGYLSINFKREEGMSKGQAVIKDGKPVLADHEYKGEESIGSSAVKKIIKDGLDANASLEVHSNVDVDIIIDFNADASVEPSDFNLAARAKELEDEERKAREEAERREKEARRRDELQQQLNQWRSDGYIVNKLESIIDNPLAEVENGFKTFGQDIEKLRELDKKLAALNTKGFESDVDSIELKLNDPEKIVELEKEIAALDKSIATRSKKEVELRKKIEAWRKEGYNVAKLEQVIETDFTKAWDVFTQFMDDLQKLKEYEARLKDMNTLGFEPMVEQIHANLKDPDALADLEQQFNDLDMRIKEAEDRKNELKKQIEEWNAQGYRIGRFKNFKNESLETIEQMIIEYNKDISALQELRERFDNLDRTDIEAEAKALESSFNDPDNIQKLTEELQKLTTKLGEIEERKRVQIDKVEEWRNNGYNLVSLEPILNDGKIGDIEKAVTDYEKKVEKLKGYEVILNEMNLVGFESEGDAIRAKLREPEKIAELDNDMKELKKKYDAAEKKRAELKKRVEGWKNEGFKVTSVELLLDGDLKLAWEEFTTMMDHIQLLKNLKDKLGGLEATGYEAEVEDLTKQLTDPNRAEELEKTITDLEEKLKAEKERRKEIAKQAAEWKKAGYMIDGLLEKQASKLEELEPVFDDFNTKIGKLKEFDEKLKGLNTATYGDEKKALVDKLKNPALLTEIDNDFNGLNAKVQEEDSVREGLRKRVEEWKADGFNVAMLEKVVNGNIDEAQKASTNLADAINQLMEYRHKLNNLDLRDFEADKDTVLKLSNDPANLTQLETIMNQLIREVEKQNAARGELKKKLEDWRNDGLVVDELDGMMDEQYSVVEAAFKKFEDDYEKLMELQKKLGGAAVKPKGKPPAPPKEEATGSASAEADVPIAPPVVPDAAKPDAGAPDKKPAEEPSEEKTVEGEEVPKKLFSEFKLNKDFVFDTFVVGTSNRFTHAAALAVAESPADAYNPLFIYGGVGLGKTHLLNSIGNHIMKNNKEANIVYVSSERFTNELINAIRYDKIDEFRDIYRTADTLIIDDIQFLAGKESTQEEFFHTFNTLYNAHKQIVVSSDRPPKDIPKLEERLRSRFEGGLITDIQPPSLETKVIILRREAKKQGIDPPDEVVHFIASKVVTNIRELRGYLTKIAAFSSLTKKDITMELAEEVLKDLGEEEKPAGKAAPAAPAVSEAPPKEAPPLKAGEGKQKLSNIEERLSSLKARLSPILNDKKNGAAASANSRPPPQSMQGPTSIPPQQLGGRPGVDAPQPMIQDVPQLSDEDMAKCGNCGAIVPANVPECPECGVSFGGEWFECPECRAAVSSDSMKCDNCGAEFEAIMDDGPAQEASVPTPAPQPAGDPDKKKKKKKKKKKP